MGIRSCAALLAVLLGAGPGRTQVPARPTLRYPFESYTLDRGFPAAAMHAICQDEQGFMWFGTESGLVRYDGASVRILGRADGLPGEWVSRAFPHPQGGLWLSTTMGVVRYQVGKGAQPILLEGRPSQSRVLAMDVDGAGRLCLGLEGRVYREDAPLNLGEVKGYGGGPTACVAWGPVSRTLWVASERDLWGQQADGRWLRLGAREGLTFPPQEVMEDAKGWLWVAGGRHLAVRKPGSPTFLDRSAWMPGGLFSQGHPYRDPEGGVWFPTNGGALRVDGDRWERLGQAEGVPSRWIRGVFRDRERSLWLISASAIKQLGQGLIRGITQAEGLPSDIAWCAVQDRSGRIWVGTDDGVAGLGPRGLERLPGTEGASVHRMSLDPQGRIWMGNSNGPLLMLRPGAARAEAIPHRDLERSGWVGALPDGTVWVGHPNRTMTRYEPATDRATPLRTTHPFLDDLQIRGVGQDPSGRLWCYGRRGLVCIDGEKVSRFDPAQAQGVPSLNGLAFQPDGEAWLWSEEPTGLIRVAFREGRFTVTGRLDPSTGLASGNIYDALPDGPDRLWVSTDRGLDLVTPQGIRHFGRGEGLLSEDCSEFGLLLDRDRNLWSGTSAGLVVLPTAQLPPPPPPPSARIMRMDQGGQAHWSPFGALGPVPHRKASLEFFFASPTYLNESALRYQVRLRGLEEEWRTTDLRRAQYPALPGGTYTFEVRAARPGGTWGPPEQVAFKVLPPFWRTWWFMILEGLALAGVLVLIVRWRLRSLEAQRLELRRLVEARTADLVEANDALTQALSEIQTLQGLIPICTYCKKIRQDGGFWGQLEAYIMKRTAAKFSHGICPDCVSKARAEMGLPEKRTDPPSA
jgi:ligand-binding sensor domain-containing protein